MPSSIQFTQHEAERIFAAFVPGFRADGHGRYRGPASYRGGDNGQALCIDTKQGKWFDFVLNEGGDLIAFLQKCERCDFRKACSIIAGIIGRELLEDSGRPSGPRYSEAQLLEADLFSVGFCWHLERLLARLKYDAIRDDKPDARIPDATRLLERVKTWSAYDAVEYVAAVKRTEPTLVAACISEVREFHFRLGSALAGMKQQEVAA